MTGLIVACAIGSWALMTALYMRQRVTLNATAVDAYWAIGIAIETTLLAWNANGDFTRRALIALMVVVWASRLAGHIFARMRNGVEDGRYTRFRKEWSPAAFYGLYLAQAALVFLLPLTFLSGLRNTNPFPTALDIIALIIWIGALVGVGLADHQLQAFRSNPANKGKTCRDGLWQYSRHPNYFFETLLWFSYIPFAVGSSGFFLALMGPALLVFLLLKVSGVPPTEAQAVASRGDDYRDYQRTTSVFIPWFPKKEKQ